MDSELGWVLVAELQTGGGILAPRQHSVHGNLAAKHQLHISAHLFMPLACYLFSAFHRQWSQNTPQLSPS